MTLRLKTEMLGWVPGDKKKRKCLDTGALEHMEEVGWHVSMSSQLEHRHCHSMSTNRHLPHTSQIVRGREKGDSKTNCSLLQELKQGLEPLKDNSEKLRNGKFYLHIRKKFFTETLVKHSGYGVSTQNPTR